MDQKPLFECRSCLCIYDATDLREYESYPVCFSCYAKREEDDDISWDDLDDYVPPVLARVAELERKLADAASMTRGAFDAALANGEERDSEKARREAAEARVAELACSFKSRGLLMDHYVSALAEIADGRPEPVDYARSVLRVDSKTAVQVQSDRQQALAGRKEG